MRGAAVQFIFSDQVLDVERRELRRGLETIAVGPQVFDLLVHLIKNRDRVVTKDDLIASVWGGRIVSESTLTSRINAARTAVGDSGEDQHLIKTLPRKGFRFVGEVRERHEHVGINTGYAPQAGEHDHAEGLTSVLTVRKQAAREAQGIDGGIFERPSVVVLPFANLSGDPEQEYFADGLTEDIINALSLWHSFPVIARGSAFAYKGQSPDVRQVGKELGARYVVEGSVRKSGNRVRITAQLTDTESGHQVWTNHYDRELSDIFALQDEIAARIAAIIEPAIANSERKRLSSKTPEDLNAWDLCIQGYSLIYHGTKEGNERARKLFERAIALDPNYARAWTGLAYTYSRDIRLWQADDPDSAAKKVMEFARQAVELDSTDSEAHLMLGRAFAMAGQSESALAETHHAIELNPQNSTANWTFGYLLYISGRADEGIPWIEKALEINPLDPRNYVVTGHLAGAKLFVGDYKSAVELANASMRQRPDYIDARVTLAAALGYLGRTDEAHGAIGEFGSRAQDYVERHPHVLWRQQVKDHYLAGLRKAGLIG
jgi:TolB-like protein/Flp pilus assembly protein TadD